MHFVINIIRLLLSLTGVLDRQAEQHRCACRGFLCMQDMSAILRHSSAYTVHNTTS